MFPKIKRLLSICGGYLKELWGRMRSMPTLFTFLTLLQVLMGSLMILHLRMEMPLLLWLGGYIASHCCPVKVRKDTSRGLNRRIEAVELSDFAFQAPLVK